jgi:hypothetical protein
MTDSLYLGRAELPDNSRNAESVPSKDRCARWQADCFHLYSEVRNAL